MGMKNLDILIMINSGIGNITTYDLSAEDSYQVMKFRNFIIDKAEILQERELKILNEIGIVDIQAFDAKFKELREKADRTEQEESELKELANKYNAWLKSRTDMLNEEVDVIEVNPLSYDNWHKLRKENRPKDKDATDPLNNYIEQVLENILWKAPEE